METLLSEEKYISNQSLIKIAHIILIGPFDQYFYYLNENAEIGDLVVVPFNKKKIYGICFDTYSINKNVFLKEKNISFNKLKSVESIFIKNICSVNFIKFLFQVAEYNMIPIGNVIEMTIPDFLIKPLKRKNKNEETQLYINKSKEEIILNEEQNKVFLTISKNLNKFFVSLINGVTGSGKTQIYIALIKKILEESESAQILILMPEISLTHSISDVIEKQFNEKIFKWHSSMTTVQKRNVILSIINGNCKIIVGARSAIFLPYKNLKIIIVDEEHDSSYKQDEIPVYHGRDMAILRSNIENIPIVLGSATPSIESYNHSLNGKYCMLHMNNRFGDAKMPLVKIIDLNVAKISKGVISDEAKKEILSTIKSNKQTMVFLNRRGYSRMLKCKNCDFVFGCINCSNKLTFHKKTDILKCHFCGFNIKITNICPSCDKNDSFGNFIPGVEKIKEEIESFVPQNTKITIFSSDEITRKDKIIDKISEIQNNEYSVIIGTQIISKGHNFSNLSLVVVIDSDFSPNSNDPRIFERLYQLLIQVTGRAGRKAGINSHVLLQTKNINNPVLDAIIKNNKEAFYQEEIARRKKALLPPFMRQINLIISSEIEEIAKNTTKLISQSLRILLKTSEYNGKIRILGPSESLIPYLKKKYRYTILLDSDKGSIMRKLIKEALKDLKIPVKVRVKIDVDPYNFS